MAPLMTFEEILQKPQWNPVARKESKVAISYRYTLLLMSIINSTKGKDAENDDFVQKTEHPREEK